MKVRTAPLCGGKGCTLATRKDFLDKRLNSLALRNLWNLDTSLASSFVLASVALFYRTSGKTYTSHSHANSRVICFSEICLIDLIHQRAAVLNQDACPIHEGLASLYLSASKISPETTRKASSIEIISDTRDRVSNPGMMRKNVIGHWVERKNTLNQQRVEEGQIVG